MRQCISLFQPHAVVHLGDYFEDGSVMAEEFPNIYFYQVPGNCDKYREVMGAPETLVTKVCGVKMFMTHGHLHGVKYGLSRLLEDAGKTDAKIVLFGHTHTPLCNREENGLWVLNPGSCGYHGGTAGFISTDGDKISGCRILRQSDMQGLF
jgi:putative phosphoesterase